MPNISSPTFVRRTWGLSCAAGGLYDLALHFPGFLLCSPIPAASAFLRCYHRGSRQRGRCSLSGDIQRKVRAPQDTIVGNSHHPQGSGKCNRKQTAERHAADCGRSCGSWQG